MLDFFGSVPWYIEIVLLCFDLIGIAFVVNKTYHFLNKKLYNYNHKEKIIIVTSFTSISLAVSLFGLAIAQFVNSIPTLINIQTLPANWFPSAFPDLLWFGVVSGVICSLLGCYLFRVNWKELRIVLSPKFFS